MEPIYLMEHLLVQSYLIQGEFEDDFDTLNTVVQRCMHISEKLGQKYTVITVDQAL
jgi:hypothetical protein